MIKPLVELKTELKKIKGLCFDIDDTFSSHGKITGEAYQSLWNLKKNGFTLIPVTGRPAGWCDLIARFWPVDGVVGENGAFSFFLKNGKRARIDTLSVLESQLAKNKLKNLKKSIQKKFPNALFASDQDYREYDLAIDFCEDVPAWKETDVDALVQFCESQGAIAKISSIHVNTWFGKYTKLEGIHYFLNTLQFSLSLPAFEEFLYVGDSPNDEPMFQAFPLSIGVSNVEAFLPKMNSHPKFITSSPAGAGFTELAALLLESR